MFISKKKERIFLYFFIFLLPLPVWIVPYPPLIDIPQHAAQIATFLHLATTDQDYKEIYEINYFTPYIIGYLITAFFAIFLPIVTSIKIVLSIEIVGFIMACILLRRELILNKYLDWLFIPTAYSFSLGWGFLNYIVAAPIAIIFLVFCLKHSKEKSIKTELLLCLCTIVLFFSHIITFVFFFPISLIILFNQENGIKKQIILYRPILISVPLTLLWIYTNKMIEVKSAGLTNIVEWPINYSKALELLVTPYNWPNDLTHASMSIALALTPLLIKENIKKNIRELVIFPVFLLEYVLTPNVLIDVFFVYQRFSMFLIPLWLFIFEPSDKLQDHKACNVRENLFIITLIIVILHNIYMESTIFRTPYAEFKEFESIIESMDEGKKALFMSYDYNPVCVHLLAWYQAQKHGIADPSFSTYSHMLVKYTTKHSPQPPTGFSFSANNFDWIAYKAWYYDYFVARSKIDPSNEITKNTDCKIKLLTNSGIWWLYTHDSQDCRANQLK